MELMLQVMGKPLKLNSQESVNGIANAAANAPFRPFSSDTNPVPTLSASLSLTKHCSNRIAMTHKDQQQIRAPSLVRDGWLEQPLDSTRQMRAKHLDP